MRKRGLLWLLFTAACDQHGPSVNQHCTSPDECVLTTGTLTGRVVAVGLPAAGAIRQIGRFLDMSPIAATAPFAVFTAQGQVLAPERLMVATSSNYGQAPARSDQLPGSIISIDVAGSSPLVIPLDFAAGGGQATALDGQVRLYSSQSATFLNSVYHPSAVTANYASVSSPRAISINNAFGRPWIANAPHSGSGEGTIAVTDPDGRPLAAVVSPTAGGVFAGASTNRSAQIIDGALEDCVGTVLLGPSPDGSGRAVFAAVNADGSLAQVHVQLGVDGLTSPGSIASVEDQLALAGSGQVAAVTHVGALLNWIPEKALFVADPLRNAVVTIALSQDSSVFHAGTIASLESQYFDDPMDLAPAVIEIVSPQFASGTTLAGGSDLYVANRGNGTVVRITQSGQVLAVRSIDVPGIGLLGPNQLNGIATSQDSSRMWLTITGDHPDFPGTDGFVVEIDAFGASGS